MRLTKPQKRALAKLTDEWRSAYDLQEGLRTLETLERHGLAHKHAAVGYYTFPRTGYKFKVSYAGKVQQGKEKAD